MAPEVDLVLEGLAVLLVEGLVAPGEVLEAPVGDMAALAEVLVAPVGRVALAGVGRLGEAGPEKFFSQLNLIKIRPKNQWSPWGLQLLVFPRFEPGLELAHQASALRCFLVNSSPRWATNELACAMKIVHPFGMAGGARV